MIKKTITFKTATRYQNRTIAHLFNQIEHQKQVLQCIRNNLPPTLSEHVQHCVVKGKKLLLFTDSAAWASQLRFYNSVILAAIAPITRENVSVMQIRIRTEAVRITNIRKPNIPSVQQIHYIRKQSLAMSDEQLQAAMLKLTTTLEKRAKQQS